MKIIIGSEGERARSSATTAADTQRVSSLWDDQEQRRIDELSSNPGLNRIPAKKSKGKLSRLLKVLDSLPHGGTR